MLNFLCGKLLPFSLKCLVCVVKMGMKGLNVDEIEGIF